MRMLLAVALLVAASWVWGGASQRRVRLATSTPLVQGHVRSWLEWLPILLRRRTSAGRRRRAAADLCFALAAELGTGQSLEAALRRAAGPKPVCPTAIGVANLGGDVAAALRLDAVEQGLPLLRGLAAVWTVSQGSGAGLGRAAQQLGSSAMAAEQIRRQLAAELAGPRATAAVLALLPGVGLLLGSGLGGSPVRWLLATPLGWLVLTAGLCLEGLGLGWVHRMVRRVERRL